MNSDLKLSVRHTKLINDFLTSKQDLKENTKQTYLNTFKRLLFNVFKNNQKRYLLARTQQEIINIVDTLKDFNDDKKDISYNNKIEYLKIFKYLLQFSNKKFDKVDKQLNIYFGLNEKQRPTKNKEILKDSNINFGELLQFLHKLKGQDYIIYYLLIQYNVRNADLIIEYTDDKQLINSVLSGKEKKNIIYINDGVINYIRTDYKTASKYGIQQHQTKDEDLIKYLQEQTINEGLFKNTKGKAYKINEISNYIKAISNRLHKGANLTQQTVYKILVDYFESENDYKRMKQITKNRGHTMETQSRNYSTTDH